MRGKILATLTLLFALSLWSSVSYGLTYVWPLLAGALLALGIYDVVQRRHTLMRNFPVVAHFRYLLEMLRPEIQQYFIESDTTDDPIARIYRREVYEKAKGELETVP